MLLPSLPPLGWDLAWRYFFSLLSHLLHLPIWVLQSQVRDLKNVEDNRATGMEVTSIAFVVVVIVESLSCVRLFCGPMDGSPPGSSVLGIFQARILEQVTIFFSRGSS